MCRVSGRNPFEGYTPEIPDGEKMDFGSEAFFNNEQQGALLCLPATAHIHIFYILVRHADLPMLPVLSMQES